MGLTLFLSGCGDDASETTTPEANTTSAKIPIIFSNVVEAGEYVVRIIITGPSLEKITKDTNFVVAPGRNRFDEITVEDLPVGENRLVEVEILKDGTVLYGGSQRVTLLGDRANNLPAMTVNPVGHRLVAIFEMATSNTNSLDNGYVQVDASGVYDSHYGISEVKWDWGDGEQAAYQKERIASHTYTYPGEYIIALTVQNSATTPAAATLKKAVTVTAKPEIISQKDEARMILIPAGEFAMGDHFAVGADIDTPVHTVSLDTFYIDVTEVTNAMYQKFTDATGYRKPDYWNDPRLNGPNHPVVGVSWHDAAAYAQWAEKRLPTEAEWEYAARGGLEGRRYPWGDALTRNEANYHGISGRDRWKQTAPVGSFPPNGYRLYDVGGNVWEWCMDRYTPDFYARSPKDNPVSGRLIRFANDFLTVRTPRVLRGGSWLDPPERLHVANRFGNNPANANMNIGFRCVVRFNP